MNVGLELGRDRARPPGRRSRAPVWLAAAAAALVVVPLAAGDGPSTTITAAPPALSASAAATFEFTTTDLTAVFECRLGDGGFAPCVSPLVLGGLGDGEYTFGVRAVVAGEGGTGPETTHSWTIDTTPPAAPTITGGPLGLVGTGAGTLTFDAEGSAECSLDGGGFTACSSPHDVGGLADGPHSFLVRATDAAGNQSLPSAPRLWTVDTTPPAVPTITGGPTGLVATAAASLTFTADAPTECSLDGDAFASCTSPHGLTGLGDGQHGFRVRAVDLAGNQSAPSASRTWTVDTTPPETPVVTGGPSGAVATSGASLTFDADGTAECSLDSGAFAACTSPHQISDLDDGVHAFAVRATDAAGNHSPASAPRTWTVDTTKPTLGLPGGVTAEADSPSGSEVAFGVTATDRGAPLPPSAVQCTPRSGSRFPLGRTTVGCAATDTVGNRQEASFTVIVRDTTPPVVNAPDATLTAPRAAGLRPTDAALAAYLNGVRATDLVSTPTVTNDAPDLLPVGRTRVTFTARDAAGNTATSAATVTVQQPGTPAPKPDVTPPTDLRGVRAVAGDGSVTLSWSAPARDVAAVAVYRNRSGRAGAGSLVYRGLERSFLDRRLSNGVRYRYVVAAFDRAGNRSRGIVRLATPKAQPLLVPRPGARISSPPLLRWKVARGAAYYNVQLWRGDRKILSLWPTSARAQLPSTWRFEGRRYRLTRGAYTWYVWPGVGAKAQARYGTMLGKSTFRVVAPV